MRGAPSGYVTSAAYGYTLGRCVAYARLETPAPHPAGTAAHIEYFGERLPATVDDEPLFDPKTTRIRKRPPSLAPPGGPPLSPAHDVIVIGLGGMGSAAAHHPVRRCHDRPTGLARPRSAASGS